MAARMKRCGDGWLMTKRLGSALVLAAIVVVAFPVTALAHAGFIAGQYDTRIVEQILNPPAPEELPTPAKAAG